PFASTFEARSAVLRYRVGQDSKFVVEDFDVAPEGAVEICYVLLQALALPVEGDGPIGVDACDSFRDGFGQMLGPDPRCAATYRDVRADRHQPDQRRQERHGKERNRQTSTDPPKSRPNSLSHKAARRTATACCAHCASLPPLRVAIGTSA